MTSLNDADEVGQLLRVDALGRVRTNPEQREAILDEFERSGTSGAAFARLHGIKYPTFASWVQRRRRDESKAESAGISSGALRLAEVVLSNDEQSLQAAEPDQEALRLELPGAASITISNRRQAQLAAELLRALRSC